MKKLTEAEKIIVAIVKDIEASKSNYECPDLTGAINLGEKLIAEQKPKRKPVFPLNTSHVISCSGLVGNLLGVDQSFKEQGNTFYTEAEAEKEVLRRAARARCIEKIADCEDAKQRVRFFYNSFGYLIATKTTTLSIENKLMCKNLKWADELVKDKQFCADYKLYLWVDDEA